MKLHALRLAPGEDLYERLHALARELPLRAGAVVTCVGSLTGASLRFAGGGQPRVLPGPFEIVSLVGTLAPSGVHLHITVADGEGRCLGGHLKPGSPVHTTAEIVVAELEDVAFCREMDPATGYAELRITGTAADRPR